MSSGKVEIVVDGVLSEVSLTADGIIRWGVDGGRHDSWQENSLELEREVLGVEVEERRLIRIKAIVEADKGFSGCFGKRNVEKGRKRVRKDFVMEFATENLASEWNERLDLCINSLERPRNLFILLNPFGGKRCARTIFDNQVKPLLVAAGVKYTLKETEHQHHAEELARKLDCFQYDGIVCVSGDGVLVEVLNGLLKREDWKSAIEKPLGIIPAGTGNGMVKSLLDAAGDSYSITNAVLAIIRGHRSKLDVAIFSQGRQSLFFSVLMLSWGLVADLDIESEKYRWMGSVRLGIYALFRIMKLRRYEGRISFVPAPGCESHGEQISPNNGIKLPIGGQGDNSAVRGCGYQGPNISFHSSDWRTIEGPFVSVWFQNVPWASKDAMLAPHAEFSDGYYDLIIVKDCPKLSLLRLLLRRSDGTHVEPPYVEHLKVKAICLEPGQVVGDPARGGIVDCDGEVLARGKGTYQCNAQNDVMQYGPRIDMEVDKALVSIFYGGK